MAAAERLVDEINALRRRIRELERAAEERARAGPAERLAAIRGLAAGFAHAVNAPLGTIIARLDVMLLEAEDGSVPSTVVADLETLRRHASRIADIANELLAFSGDSLDRAPINLNDVVTRALAQIGRSAARSDVSVVASLDPDLPLILAHADALERVALNLLTNAMQAIAVAGEIRVSTEVVGGKVHLLVADNGPGVSPEALPRIFEPFFTTKRSAAGLGLWVCSSIAQDHQATIEVRSEPGSGATFRLTFSPAPERERPG
jgi:two-component system C4-dicarboxylate transport sensor histidine kinase DctB